MPPTSDPRYRGRRTRTTRRPTCRLRTNYTEPDFEAFEKDIERLYTSWPPSVKAEDKKTLNKKLIRITSISLLIAYTPFSALLIWLAVEGEIKWYLVPAFQTIMVIPVILGLLVGTQKDIWYIMQTIFREADRRHIAFNKRKYTQYNIHKLMNEVNADHNSRWNPKRVWK